MPTLTRGSARLHYDDQGEGELLVLLHGLVENSLYWSLSGVAATLSRRYRVVSLDMRGHGRSKVSPDDPGFDVGTLVDDVLALADHLEVDRFHLAGHATGGIVAVRLAMHHHQRLLSLALTDAGAATWPGREDPREVMAPRYEGHTWQQVFTRLHANPGLFLDRFDSSPCRVELWSWFETMASLGAPDTIAAFVRGFYDDPDPRVELLRRISCPTLVLLGEYDRLFVKPCLLLAREIEGASHVVLPDVGHMTAWEAPQETTAALLHLLDRGVLSQEPV